VSDPRKEQIEENPVSDEYAGEEIPAELLSKIAGGYDTENGGGDGWDGPSNNTASNGAYAKAWGRT